MTWRDIRVVELDKQCWWLNNWVGHGIQMKFPIKPVGRHNVDIRLGKATKYVLFAWQGFFKGALDQRIFGKVV